MYMNNSPWKDSDKAYAPMFTESIVISGTREDGTFKQTIQAAVFIDMTADAISDEAIDTDRENINICCNQKDYAFVQKLLRGDTIERPEINGVKYKIKSVKHDDVMGLVIQARSI